MTAEEIRKTSDKFSQAMKESNGGIEGAQFIVQCAVLETLIEIAAQLAEWNEKIR